MFQPKKKYTVEEKSFPIGDFHNYRDEFVTCPPYQRKVVWSMSKKQALLDSLLRDYYIPKVVLRNVRLDEEQVLKEVVDGQQRITTMQGFYANELKLPQSLGDLHPGLPGNYYRDLSSDLRRFVDRKSLNTDVINGIEDPKDPQHQEIATEIFWRLQQGEPLNFMEKAHARLTSTVRNFLVRSADDYDFDFSDYRLVENNPHKNKFFRIIDRKNDRMQHMSILGRMLLIERANGPTEIKDNQIASLIDNTKKEDGIGDMSYKDTKEAMELLQTLNRLVEIFGNDPIIDDRNGVKELSTEYFIISVFILVRHLRKHYALEDDEKTLIRDFVIAFHERWQSHAEEDRDIAVFSDSRQQGANDLEIRDRIMRQAFFEFLNKKEVKIKSLDSQRTFNESERINIYRQDKGICQMCLDEDKSEKEAQVTWSDYDADHIICWVDGGETEEWNGRVLCRYHNRSRGST